jgi:hypothetical protein
LLPGVCEMKVHASVRPRPKSTPHGADSAARDEEKTFGVTTFRLLALGAGGMACLLALLPAAGHDQMWCLYAARLVRHGAKLYGPEVFESNPPLIVWLSMIPSWLAGWMRLPETAVGKALMVGIEAAVAAVCLRLLRMLWGGRVSRSVVWALGFVYVAVFAVMPARDFGQRDHILVLLCLPYVLAAAMDAEGVGIPRWVGVGIGMMAGVGIALKPHQVVTVMAVEGVVVWLRSRRAGRFTMRSLGRVEPWAIVGCGIFYVAAIRLFAGDYFLRVVPVLRETYWAFGGLGWWGLVGESVQLHVLGLVVGALVLVWRTSGASLTPPCHDDAASRMRHPALGLVDPVSGMGYPALVWVLVAAGVGGTVAFYLQGTGWYYQQIPGLSFFALALAFLGIEAAERGRWRTPGWAPAAAGGLCVLALGLTSYFAGFPFTEARSFPIDVPDASFFAGLAPGSPVATLTTTVDDTVPPVFRYGLTMAQRYPHLWMLPAILRAEDGQERMDAGQLAALEELQHAAMREDFARWRPRLVLVERCQDRAVRCQVLEDRHDDLLGWFLRDAGFRAEFAGYRYWKSVGSFDGYVAK